VKAPCVSTSGAGQVGTPVPVRPRAPRRRGAHALAPELLLSTGDTMGAHPAPAPSPTATWRERPLPLPTPDLAALWRDRAALPGVASALRAEGFGTAPLADLVGVTPGELLARSHLFGLVLDQRLCRSERSADLLAALFLFGAVVDADRWARRVPRPLRAALERLRLVVVDDDTVAGAVSITDLEGRLFLSDPLFEHRDGMLAFYANDDLAMPPHYSSLALLARCRGSGRALLDVGCGSGCLSVLLADRFPDVTAIDIGERSVWFTLLNAWVNGVRLRCRVQDCFTLAGDRRWDAVLFNAPSEITYGDGTGFRWQGDDVIRRFLATKLDALLAPGGRCLVWGIFGLRTGDPGLEEVVRTWLPAGGGHGVAASVDPHSPFALREANVRSRRVPFGSWVLRDRSDEPRLWEHLARHHVRAVVNATLEITAREGSIPT
jgi:SAM-dependent methyltransferase